MSVPKYVREADGKVAVLVSPGYGAGWSTWNWGKDCEESMLFNPRLVQAVLDEAPLKELRRIAAEEYPSDHSKDLYICIAGAEDLVVEWLEPGTQFEIREYDGSERLEDLGKPRGFVA